MKKITLSLSLLFLGLYQMIAATYYVSPEGSATAAGTNADPWSIEHAFATAAAGDTVIIKDGFYAEPPCWLWPIAELQQTIVFKGETKYGAVIDFTNLVGSGPYNLTIIFRSKKIFWGGIHMFDRDYVKIESLVVQNCQVHGINVQSFKKHRSNKLYNNKYTGICGIIRLGSQKWQQIFRKH